MTILEGLKDIIHDYDRQFYRQRNFNSIAAMTALFIFVLSLILLIMQGTTWPWIVSLWASAAIAYFTCRSRWLQADSDIIGSAMEKFNQLFPVNTNERKIAMNALEEMSSASVTAAMIVSLFGGKKSLHYYYGWSEPASSPGSKKEKKPVHAKSGHSSSPGTGQKDTSGLWEKITLQQAPEKQPPVARSQGTVSGSKQKPGKPAAGKRLNFSGIIPLQIKKKIMGRNRSQKKDRFIRLNPDRPDKKSSEGGET